MKKQITNKNIDGAKFTVRRTDERVRFFDYETLRTFTRKLWVDKVGQPYVWLNGEFRSLSQEVTTDNGIPFTICHYGVC